MKASISTVSNIYLEIAVGTEIVSQQTFDSIENAILYIKDYSKQNLPFTDSYIHCTLSNGQEHYFSAYNFESLVFLLSSYLVYESVNKFAMKGNKKHGRKES